MSVPPAEITTTGPKLGSMKAPSADLDALGRHCRNQHLLAQAPRQIGVGRWHGRAIDQSEMDATDVRLVSVPAAAVLSATGKPIAAAAATRLRRACDGASPHDRYAEVAQHVEAFDLVERRPVEGVAPAIDGWHPDGGEPAARRSRALRSRQAKPRLMASSDLARALEDRNAVGRERPPDRG